ncbi:STAS domain-containing protein [Streptomyces sp. NPDC047079]|uniref:STAS domain-containing protein n=1 Tax=Streptomyces sp. NPDC047079 TaxID=3154607 RepID=UPI0033F3FFE7
MAERVRPEPQSPDGAACAGRTHSPGRSGLSVETHDDGDRVAAVISGEVDLDTERALHGALREALRRSVTGVDLDMGAVRFCDCSGLNVLLCVRRRALKDGKVLALGATGPAVRRLLTLTDTRSLFGSTDATAGSASRSPGRVHAPPRDDRSAARPPRGAAGAG